MCVNKYVYVESPVTICGPVAVRIGIYFQARHHTRWSNIAAVFKYLFAVI